MHEVLVNRLGGLSLPRKSVVRLTDRPDMTLDVYRGRKTTIQQQTIKTVKREISLTRKHSLEFIQYVSDFRSRLLTACEAANFNLKKAQGKMKQNFDKNTKERSFKSGDKVLALLPIPGRPLQARYFGPYTVEKKASDFNYIITTPDRRKQKAIMSY